MATGGSGNLMIVEEGIDDIDLASDSYKKKAVVFKYPDTAKIGHFFNDQLFQKIAQGKHVMVSRTPKNPTADRIDEFIIEFDENDNDVKKAVDELIEAIRKLDHCEISIPNDKSDIIDEFKTDHKDLLFMMDDTDRKVTIFGQDYQEVKTIAHQIKVKLGIIKINQRSKGSTPEVVNSSSSSGSTSNYKRQSRPIQDDGEEFSVEYELTGLKVKIYKEFITRVKVDVIVNAANENMMHGGGVARVISEAAGYQLDNESKDYVDQNGSVKDGENIVTTAGRMQYEGVIHAVGPVWFSYSDKNDCLETLLYCVYNLLRTCDRNNYRTVAMPAISSGIFGVPKELCADMYIAAAASFAKEKSAGRFKYPEELHIIDIDVNILKLVNQSMEKWKKDPKAVEPQKSYRNYLKDNPYAGRSNYTNDRTRGRGRRPAGHGNGKDVRPTSGDEDLLDFEVINLKDTCSSTFKKLQQERFRWGGTAEVYQVGSKDKEITVKIFEGDIIKSSVDAIVCGTDKTLKLSGFIADALKKRGGPEFQSKFERMASNRRKDPKLSDVYKCGGGNKLGVDNVMFVVSERVVDANDKEVETYNGAVQSILEKANEWKFKRIALPMFGTGPINTNKDKLKKCAIALLKAIDITMEESRSLKEILLINKSSQVNQVLTEVFDEVSTAGKHVNHGASPPTRQKYRGKSPIDDNGDNDDDDDDDDRHKSSSPKRQHDRRSSPERNSPRNKSKSPGQGHDDYDEDKSDSHHQRSNSDKSGYKNKSASTSDDKMNAGKRKNSKSFKNVDSSYSNVTVSGASGLGQTLDDDDDDDDDDECKSKEKVSSPPKEKKGNLNIFES